MRHKMPCLVVAFVFAMIFTAAAHAGAPAGAAGEGLPQGYRRPSFYGYYPNGVPYQNYPYYQSRGETFYFHQPYYHARPAYGGGFYHPGTLPPAYSRRPIGRGL